MRTLTVLAVLVALSGCAIPEFEHSLIPPEEAKPAPKMFGMYRMVDEQGEIESIVHVGKAGGNYPDGFVRIITIDQKKDPNEELGFESFVGFVAETEGGWILHLPLDHVDHALLRDEKQSERKWKTSDVESYILLKIVPADEGLEMGITNSNYVAEQIEAGKLAGRAVRKKDENGKETADFESIKVTAEPKELREFFKQHMDQGLFPEDMGKLERIEIE